MKRNMLITITVMSRRHFQIPIRPSRGDAVVALSPGSSPPRGETLVSPFQANQILPNLYLGNANDARNVGKLGEIGVTHMINCCPEREVFGIPGVVCLNLCLSDRVDRSALMTGMIPYAIRFIAAAINIDNCNVLVFCGAGVSRSASLVIAYVMLVCGVTLEVAIRFVKSKREQVYPNLGFMIALDDLHKKWELARLSEDSREFTSERVELDTTSDHRFHFTIEQVRENVLVRPVLVGGSVEFVGRIRGIGDVDDRPKSIWRFAGSCLAGLDPPVSHVDYPIIED